MTRDQEPSRNELNELVRALPREIEPPPELWQRIATRLDAPVPRSLEERARALPSDLAPPVDLWPQIAARLRTEPRLPRARLAAAAAAVLAVGALIALAVRDELPSVNSGDSAVSTVADGGSAGPAPSTALGAAWMLRSPLISDDVAATLRRELALVRDERLSIEAAIDREPEDAGLRELWAHTYQIELQLTDACGRTLMAYERG